MKEKITSLTDRVLSDLKSYSDDIAQRNVLHLAARLDCSSVTAREVIERVRLKIDERKRLTQAASA